ncbi:MAG TPA: hypothetical protein VLS46_03045, partial [Gaiellaceae bacterium]|nr:hypothetical protein [Gaiellaceae bacterium]
DSFFADFAITPDSRGGATTAWSAELTQTITAGDRFIVALNGVDYAYTVTAVDQLTTIATRLASLVDAAAGFGATALGRVVTVTDDVAGGPFTVTFRHQTAAGTTPLTPRAVVELTGFPAEGEKWSVFLDGVEHSYTAKFRDGLATIADELEQEIVRVSGTTYSVSVVGRVLTVNRKNGATFTPSFAIDKRSPGGATVTAQLRFDHTNWWEPQRVTVMAIDDGFIDGTDALVFPALDERVNQVRGPLTIEGGIVVSEERFLNDPFRLPGETNFPLAEGIVGGGGTFGPATQISLSGPVYAGDRWIVTLNGVEYATTALAGDTLAAVASRLAALVHGAAGFSADAEGTSLVIARADKAAFSTAFRIDVLGEGDIVSSDGAGTTVALGGPVNAGERWIVTLDGDEYLYVAQGGDTLATVAAGLAAALAAASGFAAGLEGTILALTRLDGAAFTTLFRVESSSAGTIDPATATSRELALTGPVYAGDRWIVTLDGAEHSYTAQAGDSVSSVAVALVALVDALAGYAADQEGSSVVISRLAAGGFTASFRIVPAGAGTVAGTDAATRVVTLSGPVNEGDTWVLVVDGEEYAHTAVAGDTLADVAAGLAGDADADAGISAVAEGAPVVLTRLDGTVFPVAFRIEPAGTGTVATSATAKRVTLGGPVNAGDSWVIALDGDDVSYTAQLGDTLEDVAAALALSAAAVTGFDATSDGTTVVVARLDGSAFTAAFRVDSAASGTLATTARSQSVRLAGPVNAGDRWVITVGGLDFAHTAVAGNALSHVAAALASLVNAAAGYSTAVDGSTVVITRLDGSAFTLAFRLEPAGAGTV